MGSKNKQGRNRMDQTSNVVTTPSSKVVPEEKLNSSSYKVSHLYWIIPLLLTAITQAGTLQNHFVNFDDELYILLNTRITDLNAESLKLMFTTFLGGNYHPLTELSNAIDYAIAGKHDPFTYHLFNYIYHLINTFLVFVFIKKLGKGNVEVAALVALLFGIHPMHVESVAWISERKDVLYSLFYLLAMIQYLNFKEKGKNLSWILSLLFFILSCLSKSMAVTLPLVLLLIDYYWNEGSWNWKHTLNKIPFFLVALLFGIVALKSQQAQGYIADYNFSILEKIIIAVYSICFYILKLFIPVKLSCLHPFPLKGMGMEYYASLLSIPFFIWMVWKKGPYRKLFVFGLLFFFCSIILVLQFISVGSAVVAERYTYMPYIGLFFILALGLQSLYHQERFKAWKAALKSVAVIACLIFAFLSFQRIKVWKDGESLWRDCLAQYPNTADYAWYGLGNFLKDKYDHPEKYEDQTKPVKNEILKAYENAIAINSGFPYYFINGSSARSSFGNKNGAVDWLNKAINLNKSLPMGYYNRGILFQELNQLDKALSDYSETLRLDPNYWQARFNRAATYKSIGKLDSAASDFLQVIKINPSYSFSYNNLGNVYYDLGKFEEAIQQYNTAIQYDPKNSNAVKNRGAAKLSLNRKEEACKDFELSMNMGDAAGKDAYIHLCQ